MAQSAERNPCPATSVQCCDANGCTAMLSATRSARGPLDVARVSFFGIGRSNNLGSDDYMARPAGRSCDAHCLQKLWAACVVGKISAKEWENHCRHIRRKASRECDGHRKRRFWQRQFRECDGRSRTLHLVALHALELADRCSVRFERVESRKRVGLDQIPSKLLRGGGALLTQLLHPNCSPLFQRFCVASAVVKSENT